jgi:hypothetical protein
VGGVTTAGLDAALTVLELLAVVLVVRLLATEGVGDGLRWENGVVGTSNGRLIPGNLKLIESSGDSVAINLESNRRISEGALGGGEGARREGALDRGKKSSNDNPSAPVRTTRRESRLRSAESCTFKLRAPAPRVL